MHHPSRVLCELVCCREKGNCFFFLCNPDAETLQNASRFPFKRRKPKCSQFDLQLVIDIFPIHPFVEENDSHSHGLNGGRIWPKREVVVAL